MVNIRRFIRDTLYRNFPASLECNSIRKKAPGSDQDPHNRRSFDSAERNADILTNEIQDVLCGEAKETWLFPRETPDFMQYCSRHMGVYILTLLVRSNEIRDHQRGLREATFTGQIARSLGDEGRGTPARGSPDHQ